MDIIGLIGILVLLGGGVGWWLHNWSNYEKERANYIYTDSRSVPTDAPAPWPDPEIEARRAGMTIEEWLNSDSASRVVYGRLVARYGKLK